MNKKNRNRQIIDLMVVIVMAVWIAMMVQWHVRHPGEGLDALKNWQR